MAFHVGQKVVCVLDFTDKSPTDARMMPGLGWLDNGPKRGAVYTIRSISTDEDGCYIRLAEILNPERNYLYGRMEPMFTIKRFRPLAEKKTETGMAILQEILNRETITDSLPIKVRT